MSRIAVVGAGISGLACADLLSRAHDVTVYEAAPRPGGHARTLAVKHGGRQVAVDTGFIVYNEVNYPLLTRMFAAMGVATHESNMSFGVRYGDGELEFCSSSLAGLFAQKRNLASPRYIGMLRDILKFFREARTVLDDPREPTLGELISRLRLGAWFKDRFLVPMGAAIWSTPPAQMLEFPAKSFVRFFDNHGLLSVSGHHRWRTVTGGSITYVNHIVAKLGDRIRSGTPVAEVRQEGRGFAVTTTAGHRETFDEVVFASHADASLAMLADATPEERRLLGAFAFRDNEGVLHSDQRLMPRAKSAWASWVYAAGGPETKGRVSVTYWMNQLQNLAGPPLFVSLNPDRPIDPDKILDRHIFRHPVFSLEAMQAQPAIPAIQGKRGLWFCGAWQRNGFHEDGLWSAVRVVEAKGIAIPWR